MDGMFLSQVGSGEWALLAAALCCLSWIWWWLLPAGLCLLWNCGSDVLGYTSALLFVSHVWLWRTGHMYSMERRTLALAFALGLFASAALWQDGLILAVFGFCLPFLMWSPICYWMSKNSGGGSVWIPCMLVALSLYLVRDDAKVAFGATCLFFVLVSWYRQIPVSILISSLLLGAVGLFVLCFQGSFIWPLLVMLLALFQLLDKLLWARGLCLQRYWAWVSLFLVCLALGFRMIDFGVSSEMKTFSEWGMGLNVVGLVMLVVLMWMSSQEVCRYCIAPSRCRETLVSIMAARFPLLMLLGVLSVGLGALEIYFTIAVLLMAQSGRAVKLKPVTAEQILESPCRGEWASWLLKELEKKSS